MRELYDAYVSAKRRCNEDVSRISYEVVSKSVSKQIPELMERYKAKAVDFKVVIKDGKAILKAVPRT
jgi:aspartate ammonia-lyase